MKDPKYTWSPPSTPRIPHRWGRPTPPPQPIWPAVIAWLLTVVAAVVVVFIWHRTHV